MVQEIKKKPKKADKSEITTEELNIFHQVWDQKTQPDLSMYTQQSKPEITITPEMVKTEKKKLKTTKAPGPDSISNIILKGAKYKLANFVASYSVLC